MNANDLRNLADTMDQYGGDVPDCIGVGLPQTYLRAAANEIERLRSGLVDTNTDLLRLIDQYEADVKRLNRHVASIEEISVCPECGGSLLSDHDLDCAYWGRETPAWLHRKNNDA